MLVSVLMDKKFEAYFKDCKKRNQPPTVPGMAYYLGFMSRSSIYAYKKKARFKYVVSRALLRIEHTLSEMITRTDIKQVKGVQYILNNMFRKSYSDKQQIDIHADISQRVIRLPAKKPKGSPVSATPGRRKPGRPKKEKLSKN